LKAVKELRTSKALISYDGNLFVTILIDDFAALDKKDILEINAAKQSLTGENKHVVIFIPGKNGSINREARAVSSSAEVYHNAIAKAIVVKSVTHRLIATFFININRPPEPTRFFPDEKSAGRWLKTQIKKAQVTGQEK